MRIAGVTTESNWNLSFRHRLSFWVIWSLPPLFIIRYWIFSHPPRARLADWCFKHGWTSDVMLKAHKFSASRRIAKVKARNSGAKAHSLTYTHHWWKRNKNDTVLA